MHSFQEWCSFFAEIVIFKKLFSFKVIYSICNTEKTQISIFTIYCMYYNETKYTIDCVSVIPIVELTDVLS